MAVNIIEFSCLEVDMKVSESTQLYYPAFLRLFDACRDAEELNGLTYRNGILKQLATMAARLPVIWAIRDAKAKLQALGTEGRFPKNTISRLKSMADYVYQEIERPKDKHHNDKQKLLRGIHWTVFRFHSIAFSVEQTRIMNIYLLQQVLQLEEKEIELRRWGRFLHRKEFAEALAVHAAGVFSGPREHYDPSFKTFDDAQPREPVEQISRNSQDSVLPVVDADQDTTQLYGHVYRLSAKNLRDVVYTYQTVGEPIIMTVPLPITAPPFICFSIANSSARKYMQCPTPQKDELFRMLKTVVVSWRPRIRKEDHTAPQT